MKVKCNYCGGFLPDTAQRCPNCGAINAHLMRSAEGIPKTLEELKAFCAARGLPLQKMRFFIGEDYQKPKAFGIYKDQRGDFVVYKNKADGSRAVRYRGDDEAYAVNEIYQKLKSEILLRKGMPTKPLKARKKVLIKGLIVFAIIALLMFAAFKALIALPDRGYYHYNGGTYYNTISDWYYYNPVNESWQPTTVSGDLYDHYEDYWQGRAYDGSYADSSFETSEYYTSPSSANNEDDDWDGGDWDYDFGSWDSSDTDWSSDW